MADLKIGIDRDLELVQTGAGFDLQLVSSTEAIAQRLAIKLRIFLGEVLTRLSFGIAYFTKVLVKNPDPRDLDAIFRGAIIETPNVTRLPEFDLNRDNETRQLSVTFTAETTAGSITSTELVP